MESELCPVCRGLYEDRRHVCDSYDGQLMPVHLPINDWLAVYFNIDERKLDEEKRDMLQRARKGGAHD